MDNGLIENDQNIQSTPNNLNTPTTDTDSTEQEEVQVEKKRGLLLGIIVGFFKLIWWLLRMLWKLLKGMWRHKKYMINIVESLWWSCLANIRGLLSMWIREKQSENESE